MKIIKQESESRLLELSLLEVVQEKNLPFNPEETDIQELQRKVERLEKINATLLEVLYETNQIRKHNLEFILETEIHSCIED